MSIMQEFEKDFFLWEKKSNGIHRKIYKSIIYYENERISQI